MNNDNDNNDKNYNDNNYINDAYPKLSNNNCLRITEVGYINIQRKINIS